MNETKKTPFVHEIVSEYLKHHGYDGLYHDSDCGCLADDLAPCCESMADCQAGWKRDGDKGTEWDGSWVVGAIPPPEEKKGHE